MNSPTANELNTPPPLPPAPEQEIDFLELARKIWHSRGLLLRLCAVGAVIGMVIAISIPKIYTASTLVVQEGSRKRTSSSISALLDIGGVMNSSIATERDALYPSLYPTIVSSTPFLLRLFDTKVHLQHDSTLITLAQYLQEHQKDPWWSVVIGAPSRMLGWGLSLLSAPADEPKMEKRETEGTEGFLKLTREEAGMTDAIASCISVEVDKKKRTIEIAVAMQDPQVAAIVADTVQARLKAYMTEYRTSKARRILAYRKKLCQEAQTRYYAAQSSYTRYADANQRLAMLISRTKLIRLQNEMELAYGVYNQMELQVEAAEGRVSKVTPVYTVIQPITFPLKPTKPNKMLIIAGCILMSGMGGSVWVLFLRNMITARRRIKNTACRQTKGDD